jgi:hypothetical protein
MIKKYIMAIVFFSALMLAASYFFLDHALALFVKNTILSNQKTAVLAADIPDVLLPMVCIVSVLAWAVYFFDRHRGVLAKRTSFALLVGTTLPLTFMLKDALKFAFGRINTRYWLLHSGLSEFHWFSGADNYNGFPSGHMSVFTVLLLAAGTYYPGLKNVSYGLLAALALALIATDYHFLSDIIAGVYLAPIIHFSVIRILPVMPVSRRD